jgi:hypothetical protein
MTCFVVQRSVINFNFVFSFEEKERLKEVQ